MAAKSIRISVTALESWRYFLHGTKWDGSPALTQDKYIRRLRRMEPPTPAMEKGIKFHKHIETGGHEHAGIFDWQCDVELPRPSAVEVPVSRKYRMHGMDVDLRGRIDALVGLEVVDYKTGKRSPGYLDYMESWQWKAYLAMLPECDDFRYEHFVVLDPLRSAPHLYRIVRHQSIPLQRYAGMEGEVEDALREYLGLLLHFEDSGLIELNERGVVPGKMGE